MNTMIHDVLLLTNVMIIVISFNPVDRESKGCVDQEHSPLCFCHSEDQHSILTDPFLAKLSLSECDSSLHMRQCRHSRFHPPSFHLTQLIPQLVNLSRCLDNIHCLHTLHSLKHCQQCQLTYDDFYRIDMTTDNVLPDTCFYLCQHDTSCGFLCLNHHITTSIHCNICRGRRQNVTCRCLKIQPSQSCLRSSYNMTTQRWMQKRGFPAAGILALIILTVALLIIAIKLIYCQLDIFERRRNGSISRSELPTQSRQPSPSHLNIP